MTKRVLFMCTGNSARSQMAEALVRHLSKGELDAFSAGTDPVPVKPLAVQVMSEIGIDISRQRSKGLEAFAVEDFDFIITVCARAQEKCPRWPGQVTYIHWAIDDPAAVEGEEERRRRAFRIARDELRQRIGLFLVANKLVPGCPSCGTK
jgi:thioredoxin type arsenate reductase